MSSITTKKCACKWVLQHQHKLKQAVRACHLKVKEALTVEEPRPDEHYDPRYSFRYCDMKVTLAENEQLRIKPELHELKFGQCFTDHMLKIFYHKQLGGWQKPEVIPFEHISLHPAAKVLHYAVELFEGMKTYRGIDGKIRMFRPELNMQRMNMSAEGSGLPTFDGLELVKCIAKLVRIDQEWVPYSSASSLYIRPTLIGIDGTLGVAQSDSALLYTILCPVAGYFKGGGGKGGARDESVSLLADPAYTRAWPGGCGDRKMGANYGPTIRVQKAASKKGRHAVLWLYGPDHQLTEVGTMNIFAFYMDDDGSRVLVTPPLNGLILPGIIRHSILQMANEWKDFRVEERPITMSCVRKLLKRGRLLEMFGSGTACIVSPISSIEYMNQLLEIPTMKHTNPIYRRIRNQLEAIQYGHINHPWGQIIE